jgi:hypothetical protein
MKATNKQIHDLNVLLLDTIQHQLNYGGTAPNKTSAKRKYGKEITFILSLLEFLKTGKVSRKSNKPIHWCKGNRYNSTVSIGRYCQDILDDYLSPDKIIEFTNLSLKYRDDRWLNRYGYVSVRQDLKLCK